MDYEVINKGIAEKDVALLRDAIGNLCYTSRNFSSGEFDEAINLVLSKGIKLKDEALVGELVSAGKTTFTKEDFTRAVFELKNNFCDERIADVKMIGKSVYPKPAAQPNLSRSATTNPAKKNTPKNSQSHRGKKSTNLPMAIIFLIIVVLIVLGIILLVK